MTSTITMMNVDVFDVDCGAVRYDIIVKMIAHSKTSGRECWAEFNRTLLKARPDSTWQQVDDDWLNRRPHNGS